MQAAVFFQNDFVDGIVIPSRRQTCQMGGIADHSDIVNTFGTDHHFYQRGRQVMTICNDSCGEFVFCQTCQQRIFVTADTVWHAIPQMGEPFGTGFRTFLQISGFRQMVAQRNDDTVFSGIPGEFHSTGHFCGKGENADIAFCPILHFPEKFNGGFFHPFRIMSTYCTGFAGKKGSFRVDPQDPSGKFFSFHHPGDEGENVLIGFFRSRDHCRQETAAAGFEKFTCNTDKIFLRQIRAGKIHAQITIDLQIYKAWYSKHFFLLDDELMEYSVFRPFIKSNMY